MAGRGLAPLAVLARHLGAEVTGCDSAGAPENKAFLEAQGLFPLVGHSPDHLEAGTTLVSTSIAPTDEPEVAAAIAAGRHWRRTDLLAAVLATRRSAGVTGSHGKGTVAALATAAATAAGLDPLALVGTPVPDLGGMARLGSGPIVAEVDNSDLSLVGVACDVAVVTNLNDDHPWLGIRLREAVHGVGTYVANARERVVLGPSPRAAELASRAQVPVWRYGRDFGARTLSVAAGVTRLELRLPGGVREQATLHLYSPQLSVNAALAFATACSLGAEPEAAAKGLSEVTELTRRMERVGSRDGVEVFDDFGGVHPNAVREGLRSLRQHFPEARITAVLEPFSAGHAHWAHRYARALGGADRALILPVGRNPHYRDGRDVGLGWLERCPIETHLVAGHDEAVQAAMDGSRPGDVVVFFAQASASAVMAHSAVGDVS